MKIEIKHLAPYLPYKLRVLDTVKNAKKVMNLGQGTSNNWIGIKTVLNYSDSGSEVYKPILRPRADWTNQIEIDGKKIIPCRFFLKNAPKNISSSDIQMLNKMIESLFSSLEEAPYWAVQILLEWHFDIFGLIDKGLAIDINFSEA